MSWTHRTLGIAVLACLAGVSLGASCQEEKQPAKTAAAERASSAQEGAVVKQKDSAKKEIGGPAFGAQVAGRFYPGDPGELNEMIRGYLDRAGGRHPRVEGDLIGLFVPHAGYPYSGPVAAHAFVQLEGRSYRRVVVLGPAHGHGHRVPALLDASAYRTPLGTIPIDRAGVEKLAATGAARVDRDAFVREHALEVELPFLQVALGEFELVPVMLGAFDPEAAKKLADALLEVFPARDTLYVASTDMSHDYPYPVAVAMDENALRYVKELDTAGLVAAYGAYRRAGRDIQVGDDGRPEPDCAQLCGMGPVVTLMEIAGRCDGAAVTVLDRRNSGDIVGDKQGRIVGYFSGVVASPQGRPEAKKTTGSDGGGYLDEAEKKELLAIARKTLEAYLGDGAKPDFEPEHAKLKEPGAAFVTLKKHGQLRGCIGYMEPAEPLWRMIRDRAVDAAVHDSRFRPVKASELSDLTIEISVLTPRVKVKEPLEEIQIGRDGVWLQVGMHRGVFLPQVPVEQGWTTVEEYLDHLCRKAHIHRRGCWKSDQADIQRFTALVFSEEE